MDLPETPIQFVELDDPALSCVFATAPDGRTRVFYDLEALANSLVDNIFKAIANLKADDDASRYYLTGCHDITKSIYENVDVLMAEAAFAAPDAEK